MPSPSTRSSSFQLALGVLSYYLLIMSSCIFVRFASARGRGHHHFPFLAAGQKALFGGASLVKNIPRGGRRADYSSWMPRGGVDSREGRRSLSSSSSSPSSKQPHPTHTHHHQSNLQVSVCAIQGYRSYMEDEYVVAQDFAAVFDGHGGKAVSKYLRQNLFAHLQAALPKVLSQKQQSEELGSTESNNDHHSNSNETAPLIMEPTVQDYCVALGLALDKVDREVQRISHWSYQGSTAVAAWLHHNTTTTDDKKEETETTLIVANVGDSRAVYGCNGKAFPLTRDHKPDDPSETERIEKAGGSVVWCGPYGKDGKPVLDKGIYRVNGNLALSRAVGDRSERPAVTAEPDITYLQVLKNNNKNNQGENNNSREYIVLATDGLWDVFTNQEVVDLVDLLLDRTKGEELQSQRERISDVLVREALRRGTFDNVTVILVYLSTGDEQSEEQEDEQE